MKKIIIFLILLILPIKIEAKQTVRLYLFYSDSCIHCKEEKKYLEKLQKKYDYLEIYTYEVSENNQLQNQVFEKLKYKTNKVPFTVIGSIYFVGYNTNISYEIEDAIKYYANFKHKDVVGEILKITPIFDGEENPSQILEENIKLPIIGEIKDISLLSLILGFLDGLNPYSILILLFIIVSAENKKQKLIYGTTFLTTSTIFNFLFMIILGITLKTKEQVILRMLIAFFTLIISIINFNKYFKTNEIKNVINNHKIINNKNFTFIFIILLGILVNLINLTRSKELITSFTLTINNLSILNIIIYSLSFLISEIIIFIIAFKVIKNNKYTYLIKGIIMTLIASLLILNPYLF